MALTPIVFGILGAISLFSRSPPAPTVSPVSVPPGYRSISDAYFGYVLPARWRLDTSFSDANGDTYYSGPGGWAGEHLSASKIPPGPSTPVPTPLEAFGVGVPSPLTVTGGHRVAVAGASFAWQVTLGRPDGFRAQALDVWQPSTGTELWLMIHAAPSTTATILHSLRG